MVPVPCQVRFDTFLSLHHLEKYGGKRFDLRVVTGRRMKLLANTAEEVRACGGLLGWGPCKGEAWVGVRLCAHVLRVECGAGRLLPSLLIASVCEYPCGACALARVRVWVCVCRPSGGSTPSRLTWGTSWAPFASSARTAPTALERF